MVIVEPGKPAYEGIIGDGLESLQRAVRGMIECTYPFDDNAFVIGNEESKLEGLPGNRRINGGIYAGTILIAADDGCGGTTDLTEEQVDTAIKYCKRNMLHHMSLEGAFRYAKVIGPLQKSYDELGIDETQMEAC